MQVNVYRNPGVGSREYSETEKYNIGRYHKAWGGTVNGVPTLEGVYRAIALNHPAGTDGTKFDGEIGPSDIIEVVDAPNIEPGFYYINERGFSRLTEEQLENKAGFSIVRDGKEIYLTDEEVKRAVLFFHTNMEEHTWADAIRGYEKQSRGAQHYIIDRGA